MHDNDVHQLVLGHGMPEAEAEAQAQRLSDLPGRPYFVAVVAARYGGYAVQVTPGGGAPYHTLFSPAQVDAFLATRQGGGPE